MISEFRSHLRELDLIWDCSGKSIELSDRLSTSIELGFFRLILAEKGQKEGLMEQKVYARAELQTGTDDEVVLEWIKAWLYEHDENWIKVRDPENRCYHENEDEESGLDTTEDYDWTSTSTLE
jgi:hypothetical protein